MDANTLLTLLYSAHKLNHRSLADEVSDSLKSARQGLADASLVSVKTQRQADYVARRVASAKERIAELEAFQATFASCRGEIGVLPVFRDKEAVCEPALARFAQELAPEVERRVWEALYGQREAV